MTEELSSERVVFAEDEPLQKAPAFEAGAVLFGSRLTRFPDGQL